MAQTVTFLSSLAIARLYAPHVFGSFAFLSAIITVAGTVASLRLEMAIPISETEEEARRILGVTIAIAGVTLITVALTITVFGELLSTRLNLDTYLPLWLAGAAIFLIAVFNGLNQAALRNRNYGLVASRTVVQAVAIAAAQLSLGRYAPTVTSLLVGLNCGLAMSVVVLCASVRPGPIFAPRAFMRLMRTYRSFPLWLGPSALINTAGLQAPVLAGGLVLGANFAGTLAITQRILALPVAVIGAALGQVVLGEFGALVRARTLDLRKPFTRAIGVLAAVALPCSAAIALSAPWAFGHLLGREYAEAGEFARLLSPAICAQMIASPVAVITTLLGRQAWQMAWDVTRLTSVIFAILAACELGITARATVLLLSTVSVALYVLQVVICLLAIERPRTFKNFSSPRTRT